MAIEFHCEHCNHLIKAPDDAAGRMGRCPHCQNTNYIPRPSAPGEDELLLAPLDDDEESKRKKAALEDAAYQRSLLHERSMPGELPAKGTARRPGGPADAPLRHTSKEITGLIVRYVESLSGGKLEQAESLATQLASIGLAARSTLDEMAKEDLTGYGLPALPRPVLLGFLKQLKARL